MRLAALTIATFTLALAGCQAFAPEPDLSTLPHATITGSHVDVNGDRIDTFRVLEIDRRNVLPRTDQPVRLIGHDATDLLPAGRGVRVEVEGLAFYNNTARRMFWDPMHAQGIIEFVPVADAHYSLHGSIAPDVSSVWIEDDATHQPVGKKVSVIGRGAAPADAAPASAQ